MSRRGRSKEVRKAGLQINLKGGKGKGRRNILYINIVKYTKHLKV
jgi:hypothetical protein